MLEEEIEFTYFGKYAFTKEEIEALDKAIEATRRANTSQGVYHLLAYWESRRDDIPWIPQYMIDAYLEAKGLKDPDKRIPPRTLCGSYMLDERYIKRGEILPSWWERGDGAILYGQQWWSTTAPVNGWWDFAWFKVESALKYERVSDWKPFDHYTHKRRYWEGELEEHPLTGKLYRPTYSTIVKYGEIDLG